MADESRRMAKNWHKLPPNSTCILTPGLQCEGQLSMDLFSTSLRLHSLADHIHSILRELAPAERIRHFRDTTPTLDGEIVRFRLDGGMSDC